MRHQETDAALHSACKISNRTLDSLCPFWYASDKWSRKGECSIYLKIKK